MPDTPNNTALARVVTSVLFLLLAFLPARPAQAAQARTPLSVLLLMDDSGSMKDSDPLDLRVAAAESLVSALSDEDQVALVEFGTDAKIRQLGNSRLWASVRDRAGIYEALRHLEKNSQFTDFRAALDRAAEVFSGVPDNRRKVVLLLTDGILEPNPESPVYAPHHLSYRLDLLRAGAAGRGRVNANYRDQLSPIALRLIQAASVPALKKSGVEVFSVGLGPSADAKFLDSLAQDTTRTPSELHSFQAAQPTDLIDIFSRLLLYWTDLDVLQSEQGSVASAASHDLRLDEYVQKASLFVMTDGDAQPYVQAPAGDVRSDPGMHNRLHIFPLEVSAPQSHATFGFRGGTGQFRSLIVATSAVQLEVAGVRDQYRYGDVLHATANLRLRSGNSQLATPVGRLQAEIQPVGGGPVFTADFQPSGAGYALDWKADRAGAYRMTVTARLTVGRQEVLPRRGIVYRFVVQPTLYAEPATMSFGDVNRGDTPSRIIRIHSGLPDTVRMTVSSRLTTSSAEAFRRHDSNRLPSIASQTVTIQPGATAAFPARLLLPKTAEYGDYTGEVVMQAEGRAPLTVAFNVHIPSLWERARWWSFALLALLIIILCGLTYVLGVLRAPSGVLVPVGASVGQTIYLSAVRRGLFTRWLNWKRNQISLHEMNLPNIPAGVNLLLTFSTWGAVYVKNLSPAATVEIREPSGSKFTVAPGGSLTLANHSVLRLGNNQNSCEYCYYA